MKNNILKIFAKRLRELRLEADMTQEELARKAGMSVKYLQNLESSKPKNPSLLMMKKLADGLKVSLIDLLEI
jgi:transcriptional regulator with XRE-family HTH domain